MNVALKALLLGVAMLGPSLEPAFAQYRDRVPEAETDDIWLVAAAVLRQTHWDQPKDDAERMTRASLVTALQTANGVTQSQSTAIVDRFVVPEMKRRHDELTRRLQEVLVKDFTIQELRAIIRGAWYDSKLLVGDLDWSRASAKFPMMQAHFRAAQIQWIGQVVNDAVAKNRPEISNLVASGDAG